MDREDLGLISIVLVESTRFSVLALVLGRRGTSDSVATAGWVADRQVRSATIGEFIRATVCSTFHARLIPKVEAAIAESFFAVFAFPVVRSSRRSVISKCVRKVGLKAG